MPLHYVSSSKGHDILRQDNYLYHLDYEKNGKKYWKCIHYNSDNCRGRAHTKDDNFIKHSGNHNHVPEALVAETKEVIASIRENALGSIAEAPRQVIANAISEVPDVVLGALPSISSMKKVVQRARRSRNAPIVNPLTLAELEIVSPYNITLNNEEFLLFDSGSADPRRILIFSTRRNLEILAQLKHWFCDGTFSTVPNLFTQLVTLHAIKDHNVIVLVYGLLPNKTQETYDRFVDQLKALHPALNPETIMTDFETAMFSAFRHKFDNLRIRGCFFHFSQCIWRKIQSLPNIKQQYCDDANFALNLRQLLALAFVPTERVISKFDELLIFEFFVENEGILQELIDYFEDTWIGRPNRNGTRRRPLFEIQHWNQHQSTLENLPKTNNAVEGWHRAFSGSMAATHASIWKFIDTIKLEQNLTTLKIAQLNTRPLSQANRRVYKRVAENIRAIVEDYDNRPLSDYLIGIAQNLEMQV